MSIRHENGIISDNHDWFYYDNYWNTWNRVLVRRGSSQGFKREIAISLTPINKEYSEENIKDILNIRIKVHQTDTKKDIYTHVLPYSVFDIMSKHFTKEQLDLLLDKDILKYVDLSKLLDNKQNNGGVKFEDCSVDKPFREKTIKRIKQNTFLYWDGTPPDKKKGVKEESLNRLLEKYKK